MDDFRLINQFRSTEHFFERATTAKIVCAGGFIVKNDQFLFGKRSKKKSWASGVWDIVGGKSLKYENPIFTLQRETFEETGARVLNAELMTSADVLNNKNGQVEFTYHIYMITHFEGKISNKTSEHTKLKWFTRAELNEVPLALQEYLILIDEWNQKRGASR